MKRIITAAALAAALLAGAPRAAAVCPYTVGSLGRYIAPAVVQGMTATDDGNAVEVWCTDALDGDDWFFTVDNETDLRIFDRVQLVVDAAGTPDDFSDDRVIDALLSLSLYVEKVCSTFGLGGSDKAFLRSCGVHAQIGFRTVMRA